MSKATLKKELQKLTKEQLIEQVLDLYDRNKFVKEFYKFYLNPRNEKELLEKCKKEISKEFNIASPERSGLKFSVAKHSISELKAMQTSPEVVADAMLYLAECACEFTYNWGDMDELFYNAAYNNFKAAFKFIQQNGLLEQFQNRAERCVKWASRCGYGFADDIEDAYRGYYKN